MDNQDGEDTMHLELTLSPPPTLSRSRRITIDAANTRSACPRNAALP